MNKNISFSKLIRQSMVQKIWALALSILAYFFAFPIQAGIYISTSKDEMEFNSLMKVLLPRLFRFNILGENNLLAILLTACLGVFLGLYCFSYVFSRSQTDLFHSIPVKREVLFFARYLSGFIAFLLPYTFFMFVTVILGYVNGLVTAYTIPVALYMFVLNILMFVLIYSTTIIAVMLTGKLPVAILLDAVFWFFGPLLDNAIERFSQIGFYTYYFKVTRQIWSNLSPAYFSINEMQALSSYKSIPVFGIMPVVLLLVCGAIMTALSLFIYIKRPSEIAGRSLTFMKSVPIIEIPVLCLGALYGGLLFNSLATENGWMFFGVIIIAVIGHMAFQAIVHGDFKSIIKCPQWFGVSLALALSVTCLFIYDLAGYDKYIPNESKLQSAAFTSWDLVGDMDYYDFEAGENEYGYNDYYVDADTYRLSNVKITDKQLIIDLCKAAVEDSLYAKEMEKQDYYVGNDINDARWIGLTVAYNLNSANPVYRNYKINLDKHFDLLNAMYTADGFKEGTYPILVTQKDYDLPMTWQNPGGSTELSELTASEKKQLVETYNSELKNLTLYDIEKGVPVGLFYTEFIPEGELYPYNTDVAYVYPGFTKTIELLESYGVDIYDYKRAENIESITFQRYNGEGPDDDELIDFTSREDIERVLELGAPSDYCYVNSGLYRFAETYATIHYNANSSCTWNVTLNFTPENSDSV